MARRDRDEPSEDSEFNAMLKAVAAAPRIDRLATTKVPIMPGVEIDGAFRVVSKLGEGAMGVVYLATDLALDRPVALKVHNTMSDARGSRMWREAKAMARLSHPNVLTVYEVGTFGGRVFIAMELVDGGTLRDWLAERRTWQEIVEVFVQAARGLAAAHRVGLVHRDFKPTNVLVGRDGRVRVADFGLARSAEAVDVEPSDHDARADGPPSVDDSVTATGALVGTPFYMAPELRDGAPATHRADQYAFWLSLQEALRATPPPKRIRAAMARGLSRDPLGRFPDMEAVIQALTAGTSGTRKVAAAALGAGVVLAAWFGVDAWTDARTQASCEERARSIEPLVGEESRSALDDAFRETGLPYATSTVSRVGPILEAYARDWQSKFSRACVAAEVEETIPADQWAATQSCLEARRDDATAWLRAMTDEPDEGVVRDAVASAARLAALEPCLDPVWLSRQPVGRDRGATEALREAGALHAAGRHAKALERIEPLLESTDVTVEATALVLAGEIDLALGDGVRGAERLARGFELALAHDLDDLALESSTELVYATGSELRRFEEAQWWFRAARGLLERLGESDGVHAGALHSNLGIVYEAQDRPADAYREHLAAFSLHEKNLGSGHPEVAFSRNNIGTSLMAEGKLDAAAVELEKATAMLEAVLGPDHPNLARGFNNLGSVYKRQGALEEAQVAQRRAVEVFEAGSGSEHPLLATMRANLGSTLTELKRYEEAEAELRRALAVAEATQGPEGRNVGLTRYHLGNVYLARERWDDALREHRAALSISVEADGPDNPRASTSHHGVGRALLGAGDVEGARAAFEKALAVSVATRGEEHPQTEKIRETLRALDVEISAVAE